MNSTVNVATGYAPSVLLFGDKVNLNRGLFQRDMMSSKLVDCPKYIQDLVEMQETILKTSQEKVASHLDWKISKNKKKSKAGLKFFYENDLVITVRDMGSKLDFKWKGPYRVVKKLFANTYEIEDLRTHKKIH